MDTRISAVVMAVALTAACSAAPVTPPAPSTTSSTVSVPDLDRRAKAAMAPPDALAAFGGRMEKDFPANADDPGTEGEVVTATCGRELRVDSGKSVARSRVWEGGVSVFERVHAMSDLSAAVLLLPVRRGARDCVLGSPAGTVFADEPIATPPGVDESFAHCESHDEPGVTPWSCHAVLGRGTLIATIVSFGETRESASAQLATVVPILAAPFAQA